MKTWRLRLLQALLIFAPMGVIALFAGVQISSQPGFCGTCHVMRPFYESWKTSTHKEIPCVECHIPPGIAAEFEKKFEALSMVVNYFTGTYGTNPWAEIPDEACLRPGCHDQRLLMGREVFQNVLFDHRPHLGEMRREKRLRCTSCHSQIVQGQHIAVTESTCFLCHFKDTKLNEETARCTVCHETPEKIITTAGLHFDHGDVKRFDMNCTLCHQTVVKGEGEVPQERCYTCHSEPERLARISEVEFMHRAHVTDHKVDCLHCHLEIQHRIPKELEAVATRCETCHVGGSHAPQRDLYVGIGAKDVHPRPAAMYLAGVSCESCHLVTQEGRRIASEVSCMSCHGAKFMKIYQNWQSTLQSRWQQIAKLLAESKAFLASSTLLQRAEENFSFVTKAHAVHNPGYASEILLKVYEDIKRALEEAQIDRTMEPPWPQIPYDTRCTACHLGAESFSKQVTKYQFNHEPHVVRQKIECGTCHQETNYRQAQHGQIRNSCTDCHPAAERMAQLEPQECLQCHAVKPVLHSERVQFPHESHTNFGFDCTLCHADVGKFDHLDFLKEKKNLRNHEFCATCHQKDLPPESSDCLKCH
jgi:nitrate/TMAO reductase-like tetraheme cytochrome c subunit